MRVALVLEQNGSPKKIRQRLRAQSKTMATKPARYRMWLRVVRQATGCGVRGLKDRRQLTLW